ncbi:MAG TPA: PAS domain S-box protein [Syntrophales bacterium]|nr:PAS domain S-box protein [Syntrophales bacterium]
MKRAVVQKIPAVQSEKVPKAAAKKSAGGRPAPQAARDRQGRITHYEGTYEDITRRREAEEALRLSEERYRTLFENSIVGIFQSTLEGRYLNVNPAFARIYGYESPGDVVASVTDIGAQIFVDAEDRRRCLAILQETGVLERFEARTRRKDGRVIWTAINSRFVRDADGRPLFIEGMIEDITRSKQAEESLKASEERFFRVFQSNPVPMTITAIDDGRILDVNERTVELSGYPREELIGRTSVDVGLWACPRERDRLIARLRAAGSLRDEPAHFRTREGRVSPALWSADRIRLGDQEVLLTTIHDISQQVEAQEKLRQSEEQYRLLAENVADVIWTADLDLSFTYISPSSERVCGWSPAEWMSRPLRDFLTPASLEVAQRLLREETGRAGTARGEAPRVVTAELDLYRRDGSTGCYEISAQFIRDEDGRPLSIIGVTRDVAERKNAERQNALLERQLRQAQKMEAVGTLAGGIAHDFNNILFAVIGYAELCLQDETNEENRWNLSQILSACHRAKTLVGRILAFSRQVEQDRRPLDVVPLAREAVTFLRSSLPATIDLSLDAAAANSVILADAAQIHQVLMNLCTNAAHAMRASGGRLGIRIDNASPPPGLAPEGDGDRSAGFLRLSVSDTGHGIESSQLDRIFDPFFTTKAPGEGTGLGLSVVYGIVKALGGAVRVASTPGRGSTFDIYLPSAAGCRLEPERPAEPIPRGSEHILFVDDEGHLVEVMEQVLASLGYRVTAACESRDALRLFRENPGGFDLVITDMTMPGMTGAELAREILRVRPGTPIILCTGYSELIGEDEALRMGIRRFLMKPLFMGDVAREIRAVLDGSGRGPSS